MSADRQPPWSEDAEASVLGGMILDPIAMAKALEVVQAGDFYRVSNRLIFQAAVRLFERSDVLDPITLSDELRRTDDLDAAGGLAYVGELVDLSAATAANIVHHARIVADYAQLRRLIEACGESIREAYERDGKSAAEIVDMAQARLMDVARDTGDGAPLLKKLLAAAFERIEKNQAAQGGVTGLSTGLIDLDALTGGLQPGDLVVLAGRPSMGKTACADGMALHASINCGVSVGFFSLEMSKEQLVNRLLAHEGKVNLQHLTQGGLTDSEFVDLAAAAGVLNTAPIYMDDTGTLTVLELRARARRLKAEDPNLGLVIVDYIQLVGGHGENRTQEVSDVTRGLKALAKELHCPVLALSQLSRALEARTDKRPTLADLRESGSIEQDADLVMFLYRPERYYGAVHDGENVEGLAELIMAKQRNGPVDTIRLYFHKEYARFDSAGRNDRNERKIEPPSRKQPKNYPPERTEPKERDL